MLILTRRTAPVRSLSSSALRLFNSSGGSSSRSVSSLTRLRQLIPARPFQQQPKTVPFSFISNLAAEQPPKVPLEQQPPPPPPQQQNQQQAGVKAAEAVLTAHASEGLKRWRIVRPASLEQLPAFYLELSKARLAAFVVLTSMCGYAIAPSTVPVMLALPTMVFTTIGTALCVGSANAFNQWIEQPFDAQMTRTRTRVLVRRAMSSAHALGFGIASGVGGVAILHTLVNPTVAALGAANIVLYSGVYTYMKRTSIYNTWVGSVVGAIPPLMGWAASTGGTLDFPAAFVVAAVLYSWQFPHFNALSWNLRADYAKAGYHMMCVTDPKLNATVALRHAVALVPIAWLMPVLSITTPWFAITSLVPNGLLIAGAYRFYRKSDEKTARSLMFGSLVHLPLFLTLMLLHKRSDDTADMGALISIFGQSAADIIAEAKKHNPSS